MKTQTWANAKVIAVLLLMSSALIVMFKSPKVATPHISGVSQGWLFHGASFGVLPDTNSLAKPAPDTIPFFQMKEPDIRKNIAQWKQYQTQLQAEYAKAQGRIDNYEEMLQQLTKPGVDTTKHEAKKKSK